MSSPTGDEANGTLATFAECLDDYFRSCQRRVLPLVDRQPWTELAVNPAIRYERLFADLEEGAEFHRASAAFEGILSAEDKKGSIGTSGGPRYRRHLSSFLRSKGAYESLISGRDLKGVEMASAARAELQRPDTRTLHVAFLENFRCEASRVECGHFAIRRLTEEEIKKGFVGFDKLRWRSDPVAVVTALEDEYFVVMEKPAESLVHAWKDFPIALHDAFHRLRHVNLALNLLKDSSGPVMIRQTFAWNSSAFDGRVAESPAVGDDLYPSTWGGPSDEPPRIQQYELVEGDIEQLRDLWVRLEESLFRQVAVVPTFLHRAIDRFLRACQWRRTDWPFRHLLYVMSLEAIWCPESDEELVVGASNRKDLGRAATLASCCSKLVAERPDTAARLDRWLKDAYRARSRFAHAWTLESETFMARVGDQSWREQMAALLAELGIEERCLWEEPDYEIAVLHNLARRSILLGIGQFLRVAVTPKARRILGEIRRIDSQRPQGRRLPPKLDQRREDLLREHEDLQRASKRKLLQEIENSYGSESRRQTIRAELLAPLQLSRGI